MRHLLPTTLPSPAAAAGLLLAVSFLAACGAGGFGGLSGPPENQNVVADDTDGPDQSQLVEYTPPSDENRAATFGGSAASSSGEAEAGPRPPSGERIQWIGRWHLVEASIAPMGDVTEMVPAGFSMSHGVDRTVFSDDAGNEMVCDHQPITLSESMQVFRAISCEVSSDDPLWQMFHEFFTIGDIEGMMDKGGTVLTKPVGSADFARWARADAEAPLPEPATGRAG